MNLRGQYLIQIFEKIGAPLMQAILQSGQNKGDDGQTKADAQIMAELLSKSVQASIDLGNLVDVNKTGDLSDSLRVALAGLASPMIARQYMEGGQKTPGDEDIKKIGAAMQSVLSFSQNFQPDEANIARLQNLDALGQETDTHQINIQTLHAFTPLVTTVSQYRFDYNPKTLLPSIANRIAVKASEVRQNTMGEIDAATNKRIELGLLKPLVEIYCACHEIEGKRIATLAPDQKSELPKSAEGGLNMDSVWTLFDSRIVMLETLCKAMIPASSSGAVKPGTTAPATAPAQEPPVSPEPPPQAQASPEPKQAQKTPAPPPVSDPPKPPEAPPSAPLEAPASPPPAQNTPAQPPPAAPPIPAKREEPAAARNTNPMSMFAKKPATGEEVPATQENTEQPPPAPPVETSAPPEAPAQPQQEAQNPTPQTPPAPPPEQPPTQPAAPSEPPPNPPEQPAEINQGSPQENKNPMAFFKPKNEEGED